MTKIELLEYLNNGIESLVKDITKASFKNPKETAFILKYALSAKTAEKKRNKFEKQGEHIPSFLIASITNSCNLKCSGCYSHANQNCTKLSEMSSKEWSKVFKEAEELGVSAILLAGGEPLMRADIIKEAAKHQGILFPVFSNGTMLNDNYIKLFDEHRNLVPIISIEGDKLQTDTRRGSGIFDEVVNVMERLKINNLLFGASITVTKENINTVTNNEYLNKLHEKGCKAIIYVEYVPFEKKHIALDDLDRKYLEDKVNEIRLKQDMIVISFPGDEKESGGCLSAGRGFFHINANGSAEPCPFSPYSDTNIKNISLREALKSPLFMKLRDDGFLDKEHVGGCTLFHQKELIQDLL